MLKAIIRNSTFGVKLLYSFLFTLVGIFVFMVIGILITPILYNTSIQELLTSPQYPSAENVHLLKHFQALSSISLFAIPALAIAFVFGNDISAYLHLKSFPGKKAILLVIISMLTLIPFINFLAYWNEQLSLPDWLSSLESWMKAQQSTADHITKLFVESTEFSGLWANLMVMAFIPAIGEELLFRGILQKWLIDRIKPHAAIWIAAFIFAAFHQQFYFLLPLTLLGALLGYLYYYSGSLWTSIIAHLVNNATAVIAYFIMARNSTLLEMDEIGATPESMLWALPSAIVAGGLLALLYKTLTKKK